MNHEAVDSTLSAMKENARLNHVPIMEDEGMAQLLQLLEQQKPVRILEIGSAIGYSAMRMAIGLPEAVIDTVERDEKRYEDAVQFIRQAGMEDRIRIFHADALEFDTESLSGSYDTIFIDAAKGQYERFFEKYEKLIDSGGTIYCDNMHLNGSIEIPIEQVPKRNRTMVRNLRKFRANMLEHPAYHTVLHDTGDGLMVCTKK